MIKNYKDIVVLLITAGVLILLGTIIIGELHELVFGVGKKELKSFMINEERINEIYISIYHLFSNHRLL
jgi:hypothetical protein